MRGAVCLIVLAGLLIADVPASAEEASMRTDIPKLAMGLPGAIPVSGIRAEGPLDNVAKASYAYQLRGHGGADWDNPGIPGDGTGRWMQALVLLGAYSHERPEKMAAEIPRMLKMRGKHGYFGVEYGNDAIKGGYWFDHNHVLNWALDYAQYFDEKFGMDFARDFAKAAFMAREAALTPGPRQPKSRWHSWGETGSDFGALQSMSRLAMATGDPDYLRFVKTYADCGLDFTNEKGHAHGTTSGMIGWVLAYQATGEKKYLDHVIRFVETIALRNQTSDMSFPDYFGTVKHTEGCAVADWMILNLRLGQATGQARYFDRAERILWNSYLHHMDNGGSMGCGNPANAILVNGGGNIPWCCNMHGAKGIAYALMHSVLADGQGLTLALYHSFTATAPVEKDKDVRLTVKTDYPQDGAVTIRIADCRASEPWRLRLRVPAWSGVASLAVNGQPEATKPADGWLDLKRAWRGGDEVRLGIPMNVWFARPDSEEPLPPPAEPEKTLRSVRVFRGPLLMSVAKTCNEHLDASLFAPEKPTQMFNINWDEFRPPLTLTLGAGGGGSIACVQLKLDSGQLPFLVTSSAWIPATAIAKGAEAGEPAKRTPMLLVPIADDTAKRRPKVIVFDVACERKEK
jgi:hypothetical protein